jgi:hypothetical protein
LLDRIVSEDKNVVGQSDFWSSDDDVTMRGRDLRTLATF